MSKEPTLPAREWTDEQVEAARNRQYDRIGLDGDELDEIVLYGVAHLEQLDKDAWFLSLTRPDGSGYGVWLSSSKRINATFEERKGPPLSRWDTLPPTAEGRGD